MISPTSDLPIGPMDEHLTDACLAALASGVRPKSGQEAHLSSCRVCAATYAELVRLRTLELENRLSASDELLAIGHEFVNKSFGTSKSQEHTSNVTTPPIRARRLHPSTLLRYVPSFSMVALLALIAISLSLEQGPTSNPLPESVHLALFDQSLLGMVHPLVAGEEMLELPVLRGSGNAANRIDTVTIDRLMTHARKNPQSLQDTITLISAFQAAGQLRNAQVFLDAALEYHSGDKDLEMLKAIQFYRTGGFDSAESTLRALFAAAPRDELARLNLAILLDDRGDPESRQEARELAEDLVRIHDDKGLGLRAQQILNGS